MPDTETNEAQTVPQRFAAASACADAIIRRIGPDIRLGLPLGLGKPVQLANALYARAKADPELQLTILTALSLERPRPRPGLEQAFLQPFLERVYADAPELDYMQDMAAGKLPPNVRVSEFFFKPGAQLRVPHAQQNYISSNYTHAARDVFEQGCNVVAQLVAARGSGAEERFSLSCNPDTGPELLQRLQASGRPYVAVAQVHADLPFMAHEAEVPASTFDLVLADSALDTRLFSTPKQPVATADFALGLHASALVRDGGTLQIGIGALGDAVVYGLLLRQRENARYQALLDASSNHQEHAGLVERYGGRGTFEEGLYGASEMFVDGFLHLYEAGILKRRVYDDEHLQTLLNQGRVDPDALTPAVLDGLEELGERVIRSQEFAILQYHGLFRDDCRYELGHIIAPDGERIMANLAIPESRAALQAKCLGSRLRNGILLHGGFFLGPNSMYATLRDMPESERRLFSMQSVAKINQLDLAPDLYKAQRVHARFLNSGFMATLYGAVISDGLDDGRVVSGVGGQYNFVAMAHQLLDGRSILMVRSVRGEGAEAQSNLVENYGHCTIPRHLRDILVTEYGIADLRSQTDAECVRRVLRVTDARFQDALLAKAKAAHKIDAGFTIPAHWRQNTPAQLEAWLQGARADGFFGRFPLGTELSAEEQRLGAALQKVQALAAQRPRWRLLWQALRAAQTEPDAAARQALERLKLRQPDNWPDRVARALLLEVLNEG